MALGRREAVLGTYCLGCVFPFKGEKPEDAVVSEAVDARQSTAPPEENNEESEGAEDESEEESETEEESSETESDDDRTPAERGKEKVRVRQ